MQERRLLCLRGSPPDFCDEEQNKQHSVPSVSTPGITLRGLWGLVDLLTPH